MYFVMFNISLSLSSPAANGNDSRTFKGVRSPCGPSRVLHVRKVPIEVSEAEVVSLGVPFGKVTNLLLLKGKNQVGVPFLDVYRSYGTAVEVYSSYGTAVEVEAVRWIDSQQSSSLICFA